MRQITSPKKDTPMENTTYSIPELLSQFFLPLLFWNEWQINYLIKYLSFRFLEEFITIQLPRSRKRVFPFSFEIETRGAKCVSL